VAGQQKGTITVMVCKRVKIAGVLLAGVLAACTYARAATAGETPDGKVADKPADVNPADAKPVDLAKLLENPNLTPEERLKLRRQIEQSGVTLPPVVSSRADVPPPIVSPRAETPPVKPRESEPADPTMPKLSDYQDLFDRDIFSRIPRKSAEVRAAEAAARAKRIQDDIVANSQPRQPREVYVPNYDNDIVLYGLVDKPEVQQAFIDDRHAKKLFSVKSGDILGSGKVGAISLAGVEFIPAATSAKTVLVAIGHNLQGGYSSADATEPPQLRPGDQPGDEGLSPEERMKRRRMRENGIAVPATPPDAKVGEVKPGDVKPGDVKPVEVRAENKAPADDSNLSFEEKMRRRRQMEQNSGALPPPGPPRSDAPPPNQSAAPNATQPGVKPGETATVKPGDTAAIPSDPSRLDDPNLSQEDRIKILEEMLRQNVENNDRQVER